VANYTQKQMTTMADSKAGAYSRAATSYPIGNANHHGAPFPSINKAAQPYGMPPTPDLNSITHSLQGLSMANANLSNPGKAATYTGVAGNFGGLSAQATIPYTQATPYMYANGYNAAANHSPPMFTPHAPQYMTQVGYATYQRHDNSPMSQAWTPSTAGASGEIPSLIQARRGSVSSNENDHPVTPAGPYGYNYTPNSGVAVHRSPSVPFTHGTPSPSTMSLGPQYSMPILKLEQSDISPRLKTLIKREPAIPPAIPAPSSPLKSLDRALENQRGETNVYIRGLLPETTDEMLQAWGSRFGDIKSSKSIIDMQTGLCKGFGFVKYHNYEDAENCIRGFHHLGYEVSFARESFYSKLKTFSDEGNTNLYVSNLPKSMNEHELAQLFAPHKVCSSRILRDKNGNGRGVGFARFESRDACEEVIKTFNNHSISSNDEELQIQIRYADTQEQKSLKQQTQAARQFRSAEYEYATQAWRRERMPHLTGSAVHDLPNASEFDQYVGTTASVPIEGQRWIKPALAKFTAGRTPLSASTCAYTSQVQPGSTIAVAVTEQITEGDDSGVDMKPVKSSPKAAQLKAHEAAVANTDVD